MARGFSLQPVDPFSGRPLGPPMTFRPIGESAELAAHRVIPPPPSSVADADPYPEDGTIPEVLAWVDRPGLPDAVRSDRAKAAIAAEHGRGRPRTTLLRELSERTG